MKNLILLSIVILFATTAVGQTQTATPRENTKDKVEVPAAQNDASKKQGIKTVSPPKKRGKITRPNSAVRPTGTGRPTRIINSPAGKIRSAVGR